MRQNENTLNEIEQERASYLLNLDDMNYELLAEPVIRNNSALAQNTYIGVLDEINLVNGLIYTEDKEIMEILDIQNQIEFPNRDFQAVQPYTLKDEIAENSSYSE
jgi:hypothetical protein